MTDEPSAPLARPRGLRADAAATRERVLAAAAAQLAAPGGELAMNGLARDAGLGVGTVYRHFPTRQVLLEALAAGPLEELVDAAERACAPDAAPGSHPAPALEVLLRQGLRRLLTDPALAAVLARPTAACADTAALLDRYRAALQVVLDRERAAGRLRDDVDADDVRRLLHGLAGAVGAGTGRATPSARYVDVLLRGLGPTTT